MTKTTLRSSFDTARFETSADVEAALAVIGSEAIKPRWRVERAEGVAVVYPPNHSRRPVRIRLLGVANGSQQIRRELQAAGFTSKMWTNGLLGNHSRRLATGQEVTPPPAGVIGARPLPDAFTTVHPDEWSWWDHAKLRCHKRGIHPLEALAAIDQPDFSKSTTLDSGEDGMSAYRGNVRVIYQPDTKTIVTVADRDIDDSDVIERRDYQSPRVPLQPTAAQLAAYGINPDDDPPVPSTPEGPAVTTFPPTPPAHPAPVLGAATAAHTLDGRPSATAETLQAFLATIPAGQDFYPRTFLDWAEINRPQVKRATLASFLSSPTIHGAVGRGLVAKAGDGVYRRPYTDPPAVVAGPIIDADPTDGGGGIYPADHRILHYVLAEYLDVMEFAPGHRWTADEWKRRVHQRWPLHAKGRKRPSDASLVYWLNWLRRQDGSPLAPASATGNGLYAVAASRVVTTTVTPAVAGSEESTHMNPFTVGTGAMLADFLAHWKTNRPQATFSLDDLFTFADQHRWHTSQGPVTRGGLEQYLGRHARAENGVRRVSRGTYRPEGTITPLSAAVAVEPAAPAGSAAALSIRSCGLFFQFVTVGGYHVGDSFTTAEWHAHTAAAGYTTAQADSYLSHLRHDIPPVLAPANRAQLGVNTLVRLPDPPTEPWMAYRTLVADRAPGWTFTTDEYADHAGMPATTATFWLRWWVDDPQKPVAITELDGLWMHTPPTAAHATEETAMPTAPALTAVTLADAPRPPELVPISLPDDPDGYDLTRVPLSRLAAAVLGHPDMDPVVTALKASPGTWQRIGEPMILPRGAGVEFRFVCDRDGGWSFVGRHE